jgi:hypothetical protein
LVSSEAARVSATVRAGTARDATKAGDRINDVNSALMVLSCIAAYAFPFELFLFSYAVLGPLHYLTEISWLHDRGYFVRRPDARARAGLDRFWLVLVGVTLAVMLYGVVGEKVLGANVSPVWEIGLFYLVFVTAAVVGFVRNRVAAAATAVVAAAALALFARSPWFALIAFLLITIVHVLVFTAAFILLGALKSRSRSGFISLGVFAACIASFFVYAPDVTSGAGDFVRGSYASFEALNAQLIRLFGLGTGTTHAEIYASTAGLIVMRLIAFAYTYHYLNWFSKTSVIRWHAIPKRRTALILALWVAALVPFAFSYAAGFVALYLLSVLHVMLEFPLNHQSFVGIGKELGALRRARQA